MHIRLSSLFIAQLACELPIPRIITMPLKAESACKCKVLIMNAIRPWRSSSVPTLEVFDTHL